MWHTLFLNSFLSFRNKALNYSLLLLLGLFLSPRLAAQDLLESLAHSYEKTANSDPSKFYKAGKYAQALFFQQQEQAAMQLLEANLQRALKLPDGRYTAYLYAVLAMNSRILDQSTKALQYILLAQQYANRTKDLETKGYINYCQGWLHTRNNQQAEAVRYLLMAHKQLEQAAPSPTLRTRKLATLTELTSIYAVWKAYDLQEKYGKQALALAIQLNQASAIFDAYMLMGYLYEQQYVADESQQEKLLLTEKYYLQAIETYQNNKTAIATASNLSFAAINLANLYLHYFPDTENEKAVSYALLAMQAAKESKQYSQLASAYGILAEVEIQNKHAGKAKEYLLASLAAIQKDPILDQNIVMNIYQHLAEVYEKEANFKEAIFYYKAYSEAFALVYDRDKMEQGRRLEAQFEKERQQQQLLRLELEAEKKEQQLQLMHARAGVQQQQLKNLKLNEENNLKELELAYLSTEKQAQELKLSHLEGQKKAQELLNFQTELGYKEKLNRYYALIAAACLLLLLLILYAYFQRSKRMQQQQELHLLAIEKEKQFTKISNLTAMLDGQEQERGRLARDLHDGLGSLLSSTKLNLSHRIEKLEPLHKQHLQSSLAEIDTAVNELRRVAHNLMPDLLIKYGLEEVLRDYASRMTNDKLEISIHFLHYQQSLSEEQQLLVYRIIQELVNNAIKHADADQLLIQLVEEDGRIAVTVEDNGKGFALSQLDLQHSAGLHNIQSRVHFLKGQVHIQSEINLGTTIEFDFPLDKR